MTSIPALYGVIGNPIAHSLSPLIHSAWIADAKLHASYAAYKVAPDRFNEAMSVFGDADFRGFNVTLPFKHDALAYAPRQSNIARRIGAANTLVRQSDGDWFAENTDVSGFALDFERHYIASVPLDKSAVLLVGAGGASRAVVAALLQLGVSAITLLNRTESKAAAIVETFDHPGVTAGGLDSFERHANNADVLINGIAIGHDIPLPSVGNGRLYYDLSYGPSVMDRISIARNAGWKTVDGLGMLIGQAAKAFELWFGKSPDLDLARARCEKVLTT